MCSSIYWSWITFPGSSLWRKLSPHIPMSHQWPIGTQIEEGLHDSAATHALTCLVQILCIHSEQLIVDVQNSSFMSKILFCLLHLIPLALTILLLPPSQWSPNFGRKDSMWMSHLGMNTTQSLIPCILIACVSVYQYSTTLKRKISYKVWKIH